MCQTWLKDANTRTRINSLYRHIHPFLKGRHRGTRSYIVSHMIVNSSDKLSRSSRVRNTWSRRNCAIASSLWSTFGQIWDTVLMVFFLHVVSGPASRIVKMTFKEYAHLTIAWVHSWVSREHDPYFGGEKIIFAMLYTHVRCLQVMYVISHVCVSDFVYVTTLCGHIHEKGFTFNSHVWMHITTKLVINP